MKLLVVEDNARLRELIKNLLARDGHSVDATGSVEETYAALRLVEYDAVLLDLSLPDGDGRQILRTIRRADRRTVVLILTARYDIATPADALNAGADDYIAKPFSDDELVARLRALGRRLGPMREQILSAGNVRFDTESMTLTVSNNPITMSRRELLALSALLAQQNRVLPREKLESVVYPLGAAVTDNALEALVSRMRKRLLEAGATVNISSMRGIGYILTEADPCLR